MSEVVTKRLGNLDLISRTAIGGWYINSESQGPASLRLYADGALVAEFAAQEDRIDVSAAGFGAAECGFHIELPPTTGSVRTVEIVDAADDVCVWRIDIDAQRAINNLLRGELPAETGLSRAFEERNQVKRDETGLKILFDVSDLVYYIGHHDNLTGIQRVQSSVIQAMIRDKVMSQADVGFIAFDSTLGKFQRIDERSFLSLLADMSRPLAERTIPDYVHVILGLKRRYGVRFVPTFHDLIPIYAKETCDQGTAEVFKVFLDQILRHVDVGLCVSENTARDLERYCAENGIEAPPTRVTRNGSSLEEFFPVDEDSEDTADSVAHLMRDPYVLFVSTIEGRKNHLYAFQIWERLVNAGVNMPRVVCVGRLGWRSEAFLQSLLRTDNLGGRFEIVEDISDAELKTLYQNCEFTIYPSQYEGWGLPIGESLSYGKPCVLTDNSSLPEVAGDLGVYIPGNDVERAAEIVRELVEKPERLAEISNRVAKNFKPVRWAQVAANVADGCRQALSLPLRNVTPIFQLGIEYTFRQLRVESAGKMGQQMLDGLLQANRRNLLSGHVRHEEKVYGLESRSGHWYSPEPWGCWARGDSAHLKFEIATEDVDTFDDLLIYAALQVPPPYVPCSILLELEAGRTLPLQRVLASEAVYQWRLPANDLSSGCKATAWGNLKISLNFRLQGVASTSREELKKDDARQLGIGLKSLMLVKESDYRTRISVIEEALLNKG